MIAQGKVIPVSAVPIAPSQANADSLEDSSMIREAPEAVLRSKRRCIVISP